MNVASEQRALSWRSRLVRQRALAYVLALVLPFLSAFLTAHSTLLQTIPFSLYFVSVALIGSVGGFLPSLLAVGLCMYSRTYFPLTGHLVPLSRLDALRACVLLTAAVTVSVVEQRRRRSAASLGEALEVLQERTDALVESLHSGKCASWVLDLTKGHSARWYSGSYPVFGRPFSEVEQMASQLNLVHPEDQERVDHLMQRMMMGREPMEIEFRAPWPDGETHWLNMRANWVPGAANLWRGVTMDVTERKLAESALLKSEKLAAMGRLASTVAHEINNPLEAITNLLYLAQMDEGLSASTRKYLTSAESELARLGNITRLTLGFVRTSAQPRRIVIATSVEEVLAIFHTRSASKGIVVERRFEEGVTVEMAPHELRQILTNLISNAVDAVADAHATDGPKPRLVIQIRQQQERAVLLLEDNGSGIPETHLERIFEPFYTTKEDVGTGIGLWVTQELVEKNAGSIAVESGELADGMKTRFRIELPLLVGAEVLQTEVV